MTIDAGRSVNTGNNSPVLLWDRQRFDEACVNELIGKIPESERPKLAERANRFAADAKAQADARTRAETQFTTVFAVLAGATADEIFRKIIKAERSNNPVARAVLDEELGIARAVVTDTGPKNLLAIQTKTPARALRTLSGTPGVAYAFN